MLPNLESLKRRLEQVVLCKHKQGHDTTGLLTEIKCLPDSYDAVRKLSNRITNLPIQPDWSYIEPNQLPDILEQCASEWPTEPISQVDPKSIALPA